MTSALWFPAGILCGALVALGTLELDYRLDQRKQRRAKEAAVLPECHCPACRVMRADAQLDLQSAHATYLWGDVPALMPTTRREVMKSGVTHCGEDGSTNFHQGRYDDGVKAGDRNKGRANGSHKWTTGFDVHVPADGFKSAGMNWSNQELRGQNFTRIAGQQSERAESDSFGWAKDSDVRNNSSKSAARKAASARIAKIPAALSRHIAQTYFPEAR